MSGYVRGELTVGVLKKILSDCDRINEDTPIKFKIFGEEWDLEQYMIRNEKLIFTQPTRKISEMSNRFVADHTTRKGSWIEDFKTGKKYHIDNQKELGELLDLLNEFDKKLNNNDIRFYTWYAKGYGIFIGDKSTGREYNLGISTSIVILKNFLNEYDYLLNEKSDLPYSRVMM